MKEAIQEYLTTPEKIFSNLHRYLCKVKYEVRYIIDYVREAVKNYLADFVR